MRKMIESQRTLGTVPMSSISFDIHCRHEIVPILMALQHTVRLFLRHTLLRAGSSRDAWMSPSTRIPIPSPPTSCQANCIFMPPYIFPNLNH